MTYTTAIDGRSRRPLPATVAYGALVGLMELVILIVGLDIGVLSPTRFAIMVVMALVTTARTTPLLDALIRGRRHADPAVL